MQAEYFSATLGREAALSLDSGASSWACAHFGGHAASRRGSPSVAVAHHSAWHEAPRAAGAAVAAPHVPALVSIAGFSLAHGSRFLLLHVETHLVSEHDGLWRGKRQNGSVRNQRLSETIVRVHINSTLAARILCTGSESSKTTNPKLGSFPPTPLVLIRSSNTFPYA